MSKEYAETEIGQVKLATAALIGSLVKTLTESDPSFRDRFKARVDEWYYTTRDGGLECTHALELMQWTISCADAKRAFVYGEGED